MKSERSKFRETQESSQQQRHTSQTTQTFGSVEDLLRHDRGQNPIPPEVADRLNLSIAAEPKPAKSWFKNLFGSRA